MLPMLALIVMVVHIQGKLTHSTAVACCRMQVASCNKAHFMVPMLALIVIAVHIQAKLLSQHSCGMQSHAGCI